MKIRFLQHEPFEDPGLINCWAKERGHDIKGVMIFQGESFDLSAAFDMLVVMGGSMSVYEEHLYPWLALEKKIIEHAIATNKPVLGVCLGAQLIASVMGARIYKNKFREIGWHAVQLTEAGLKSALFEGFPSSFKPFHWHGDTFEIPASCVRTSFSEACVNQSFEFENRVVGLQFHLESTVEHINGLISNCSQEMVAGPFVQSENKIIADNQNILRNKSLLYQLLDNIQSHLPSERIIFRDE